MADPVGAIPDRHRLAGVDVLRGISVLLVTLHHIHLRFWINDYDVDGVLPKTLNQVLFWSGYYAVIVFFVISGFLITSLSIRRWGELGHVHAGRFYLMRAARILPCLLLVLLVLSALHLAGIHDFVIDPARAFLGQAVWSALTFNFNLLEGHHGYLPGDWDVLWSLSVEEAFYVLFPLACLLLRRESMLLIPLVCLLILGPVNRTLLADQDPWGQYAYLCCTDGIAFGCLTALACAHWRLSRNVLRWALVAGTVIAVFVIVTCNEDSHVELARYGLNVTLLEGGVALMLLALGSGVGNRLLATGTGWLRRIGRNSYEIYLVHMLVVLGLMNLFRELKPPVVTIPLWYAAMLLPSLLLGYLLSRYYSEPLNERLRRRGRWAREVPDASSARESG
ncbi:MAG TPA: acyltransferase [Steroidobacteraceae bacterium]|nr:acyltransferase [Steroidobacteraceae bacterium]